MMEFDDPGLFAAHLERVAIRLPGAGAAAMDQGAKVIQDAARASLGHYQGGAGPFVSWAPLARRTNEDRSEQGYPEDEPLRRSGLLRDNIERCSDPHEARVGVPDRDVVHPYDNRTANIGTIAVEQELGTATIPPRSFLGHAAFVPGEGAAGVVVSIMAAAVSGLTRTKK